MKTPFSLHAIRAQDSPLAALLLLSRDPADLLGLCLRMNEPEASATAKPKTVADASGSWLVGQDPCKGSALPTFYPVASGFLVRLPTQAASSRARSFAGAIRLRQLAANLFLPLGAELWPGLLPDEAEALVQKRGLVFLPGGPSGTAMALGFDPAQPVPLARLLAVSRVQHGAWQPLPRPKLPAERLTQVLLDRPRDSSDTIIATGGEDIGVEEPTPPPVGPTGRAGAQVRQGLGAGLGWLGRALGWSALARLGGQMADTARQALQGISDSIRDRQEAALRRLLQWFQEGQLETALRHALPLGEQAGRGGGPANAADLPTNDTRYSLAALLSFGGFGGGYWSGGIDLQAQLAAEYRKAAEAATARGDFRRAAFIYGKLLRDYRLAAGVLSRGGLNHDAAILYLEKLADFLAAAREFEAAGEFDQAVQLYRQRGEHVLAGDLLRKMGEEQQAVAEYERAVLQLLTGQQYHAAGELVLSKLSQVEKALECFRSGWRERPHGSYFPCLNRLAQLLAEQSKPAELLALVDETAAHLTARDSDQHCSTFFGEVVRLSDLPNLCEVRDRLRDRALQGLAGHLRSRARAESNPAGLVSTLFGQAGVWAPAQVSDAQVAVKALAATRKVQKLPPLGGVVQMRLHDGRVCSACAATESGTLFVAFEDGTVRCFEPETGIVHSLPAQEGPAWCLATDPEGRFLLALSRVHDSGAATHELTAYQRRGKGQFPQQLTRRPLSDLAPGDRVAPLVFVGGEPRGAIWSEDQIIVLQGTEFLPVGRQVGREHGEHGPPLPFFGLLGVVLVPASWNNLILFDEESATLDRLNSERLHTVPLGWNARPKGFARQTFLVSGDQEKLLVNVIRIGDSAGQVFWSRLLVEDGTRIDLQISASSQKSGYLAAAQIGTGRLAAIHEGGIDWLRFHQRRLEVSSSTSMNLTGACECFFSPPSGELLIVCEDGYLVRVPVPR